MPSPATYNPPRTPATVAVVLLSVCAAAALLSLAALVNQYGLLGDLAAGASAVSDDAVDRSDRMVAAASFLELATMLATAVAFIIWFHRVRVNAELFDPSGHRRGRGWAIGSWFTPFVALWFPRQIAGDIWQASITPDERGVRARESQALLSLWWAAFIGFNVLSRLGSKTGDTGADIESLRTGTALLIVSDAVELAAAVLAILVVRKLTAMQEQQYGTVMARAYGMPPAGVLG
ncbi:DUF4328 domain-containing protein [Kitasatospora sp. NPDC048365]|uniref:DUF4328 domain-containing protein n=1 Tax=Kitasatospora sp. NPDC048365 TaxID=3364050 RepID=UPI003713AC18